MRRVLRTVAMGLAGLAVVWVVFGYQRVVSGRCPECWASERYHEVGLALSDDWRWGLWSDVDVTGGPGERVGRFLPSDHVHRADPRFGSGSNGLSGPYFLRTTDCFPTLPSEFARALLREPGLSDYVAARVADGSTDAETVRRLIAVPPQRGRDPNWEIRDGGAALFDAGDALVAGFQGVEPEAVELWSDRTRPRRIHPLPDTDGR